MTGKKKHRNALYGAHVTQYRKHVRNLKARKYRNYSQYEKNRRGESKKIRARIKRIKKLIPSVWKDATDAEIALLLCVLDMVFHNHSYRIHVTYMELHQGTVNTYGLKKIPSKSTLGNMAKSLSGRMGQIKGLLLAQAGDDTHGSLGGDSSGFSIAKYEDWEDAKKGLVSRRGFDKLHILVAPHGMISACEVTCGRTHDSPVFRTMFARMPQGSGDVLLDAAYLAGENCRVITDSGRRPVICPKGNSVPRGFTPMGKMLRWHRDDPKGFEMAYHQRSLVEDVFSVIKERFGAVARARSESVRRLQLTIMCVCYNLIS